ncbi:MAG: hypothetical protein BGP17_13645 [Sphingomonas sp. 67-41]|nr:MAG: hypothetical protein BGP17_13645 [Sphingomonas sp. 67-41]
MEEGVYTGVGVIVARAGRTVFERHYGGFGPETVEHVASAGKWVAAATIAALVDRGVLRWEDRAGRFVEGLNPMMARATLRQLLSHTAGYPDYQPADRPVDNYASLAEAVDHIRILPADAAPGARFKYGGLAMQVAGRMAEIAANRDWDALFRTLIGGPLGMSQSGFTPVSPEHGFGPMLGGGLHTSARDMMKFLAMIEAGGSVGGRQFLSRAAVSEMQADQVRGARVAAMQYVDQARVSDRTDIYGLGEWREETGAAGEATLVSSPGWAGAYPWIDRRAGTHGMVIAKVDVPRAAARGFNAFLSSPVVSHVVRDAATDLGRVDWRRGYAPVPDGRLYWEACGDGPPLVLLHGHSFDRTMWDPQVAALALRYQVIRYDLRGYGRSSLPVVDTPFTHAADLVALLDRLGIARTHVAGLSLGGAVATDMLALHPDRLLSAIAASGDIFDFYPGFDEPWTDAAREMRGREIAALRQKGVWQFKRDWLDQLTAQGGSRVETIRPHLWKMISMWSAWQPLNVEPRLILGRAAAAALRRRAPDMPTLILTPETVANQPNLLAPLLPDVRTVIVADAGHVANLEQPQAFTDAMLEFLKSVDAR